MAFWYWKRVKEKQWNGVEQPNQESIRTFEEKENYKYPGILEAEFIKQIEMKEKVRKGYPRTRKLLETKLCRKKSHQGNKHLGSELCKVLWNILKNIARETQVKIALKMTWKWLKMETEK